MQTKNMKKISFFIMIFFLFPITAFYSDAFELPDEIQGITVPKPTAEIVKFDIDSIKPVRHNLSFRRGNH